MTHDTPPQSEDEQDPEDMQNVDSDFKMGPEKDFEAPFIEEEDELSDDDDDDQDMDDDGPGDYDENVVFESGEDGEEEPFYPLAEDHDANMQQIAAMLDDQLPVDDEETYEKEESEQEQEQFVEVKSTSYVSFWVVYLQRPDGLYSANSPRRSAIQVEVVLEKKGKRHSKAPRSRSASVVEPEPPYRNTRSRSRSVEPIAQQTAHSRKRNRAAAKMQPIEENGAAEQAEHIGSEDDSDEVAGIIGGPNGD